MKNLLIINNKYKAVPEPILKYLDQHYQISSTDCLDKAFTMVENHFFDLFLIIAPEINACMIKFFDEIRKDRSDLLPVIISLPEINERTQAQAFSQRIFYLTEYPLNLERLKKEFVNISEIMEVVNDKVITLSTRRYDKEFRVNKIIYFKRSSPRMLTVCFFENGKLFSDEYFYKASLEKFIDEHALRRHFVQVHQSYVVNPSFIEKIDKIDEQVVLNIGKKIPLGATYHKRMKKGVGDHD